MIKVIAYLLLMMTMNLRLKQSAIKLERQNKESRLFGYGFGKGVSTVIGMGTVLILQFIGMEHRTLLEGKNIIFLIVLLFQALFSLPFFILFFRKVMAVAQDFEKVY